MFIRLFAMVFACLVARGQTAKPVFEAATVKTAIPLGPLGMRFIENGGPGTHDPGLYRCQNCSLYQVVMEAYDIRLASKFSGPDWLQTVRFDISAKVPEGATKESFHLMMQDLLAERFKLAVHREKKEMPVFELSVAKNGPKFQAAVPKEAPPEDAPQGPMKRDGEGYPILAPGVAMAMVPGHARLRSENQSMEWFADMLSNQMGGPIVDATGLKGKYDFVLSWALEERNAAGGGPSAAASEPTGPDLRSAIQTQLGLRLQEKKGPVDVLVIDHIEKDPTEN